jgi:hypothetical protein
MRTGLVEQPELRHRVVELRLEGGGADQERAGDGDVADPDPAFGTRGRARRPAALGDQHPQGERRQGGPADHLDVRRAPQRHVLAEDAVPDVVQREAEDRDDPAEREQQPADGHVPVVPPAQRRRVVVVGAEDHRERAGEGDPEQAHQDEPVRRVREGARVTAVVDVARDVPVEPEHGHEERHTRDARRQRGPPREPARALAERRRPAQERGPTAAVRPAEGDDRRDQHDRDDGRRDQLLRRRPAGGSGVAAAVRPRRGGRHQRRRHRPRHRHGQGPVPSSHPSPRTSMTVEP